MRIRAAQTLVFLREQGEIIGFNYLTKSTFQCSNDLLTFLSMVDEWTSIEDVVRLCRPTPADQVQEHVSGLASVDAVVVEGTEAAHAEKEFQSSWKWGMPAALFHQTVQDRSYMTIDEAEILQRERLEEGDQPGLFLRHDTRPERHITLPDHREQNEVLGLMARRRTVRSAGAPAITLDQLADCLFAGLGITGTTQNGAGVTLPLTMTPSGGARNPFEAYVYARDVDDLSPGFYHYSAYDHALERVATNESPRLSELMGGQDWADEMPCMILLCAFFERTMWKYQDANAYRVVLIEAGHIGQNIMLAATHRGLSACPSAAIDHQRISQCLGLGTTIDKAPVYALTLAEPGKADPVAMHRAPADSISHSL